MPLISIVNSSLNIVFTMKMAKEADMPLKSYRFSQLTSKVVCGSDLNCYSLGLQIHSSWGWCC